MTKLPLSLATGYYDRVMPLRLGEVQPEGIDLNHLLLPVEDVFWRMVRHQEFDAAEMSLGAYLTLMGTGDSPFIAIPVFPSKYFRHSCVFVNTDAGLQRMEDLRGRHVGIPEYAMTAIVWLRGILHHEHGVSPEQVTWFRGGLNTPGRIEKVTFNVPANVRVEELPAGKTLSGMLESGELDAAFCARAPDSFLSGSPRVGRLFPNPKQVEQAYYRRTGIHPIMHTVVIRRSLYERNRWVARSLYRAFEQSRELAYNRLHDSSALSVMLPWTILEAEETRALFGGSYWAYGVGSNRKALETFTQYVFEHGITPRKLEVDTLFASETLDETIV
jgi:4,5-dihydroxyphthalate decarboxylase